MSVQISQCSNEPSLDANTVYTGRTVHAHADRSLCCWLMAVLLGPTCSGWNYLNHTSIFSYLVPCWTRAVWNAKSFCVEMSSLVSLNNSYFTWKTYFLTYCLLSCIRSWSRVSFKSEPFLRREANPFLAVAFPVRVSILIKRLSEKGYLPWFRNHST